MHRPPRAIPIVILLLLIAAAAYWYFTQPREPFSTASGELTASGTIEAREDAVVAEVGGRVAELLVGEGDTVEANAVVARLDSAAAQADIDRAQAALAEAQARLQLAQNGARAEDIAQADASVAQAIAAREGAKRAWEDARAQLADPQELNARIDAARTAVKLAAQQIEAAQAQKTQVENLRVKFEGRGSDLEKTFYDSYTLQIQAAEENLAAVEAQRDAAQTTLDNLLALHANPLDLQAKVHQAEARYRELDAAVKVAEAARDLIRAGATQPDLALAQAGVDQAKAALTVAQARFGKLTLCAPTSGIVSKRTVNLGEVIAPGATLFTVSDPARLTLTVYVPENLIGQVTVSQSARVRVDSFPGREFSGAVIFVSTQAEFTPRNVQTVEGRATQVFAVKIRLEDPTHELKAGLPADAIVAR
jgi:multidrug resistance efflux pump